MNVEFKRKLSNLDMQTTTRVPNIGWFPLKIPKRKEKKNRWANWPNLTSIHKRKNFKIIKERLRHAENESSKEKIPQKETNHQTRSLAL